MEHVNLLTRLGCWLTWQRVPAREIPIAMPRRAAFKWLLFAIAYVGLAFLVGLLIRYDPHPLLGAWKFNQDFWYAVVFKILGLLIVPLCLFFGDGYRLRDLLFDWRACPRTIVTTVLAFGVGIFINADHIPQISQRLDSVSVVDAGLRIALGATLPLFTAGLPEEIVYRGVLQTRLEKVWGRAVALPVTALLFTAWHLPTRYLLAQGVEGQAGSFSSVLVGTGIPVFIVGLAFGVVWQRYRSLPPLIACHWGMDTLPYISSFVGARF
jgi:membrane protease YdiL (CAAX protease family)